MNYPFDDLAEYCRNRYRPNSEEGSRAGRVGHVEQALSYRWNRRTITAWARNGLQPRTADRVACELGSHIDIIWPERRAA